MYHVTYYVSGGWHRANCNPLTRWNAEGIAGLLRLHGYKTRIEEV